KTNATRNIQQDNGVAGAYPHFNRASVISIHYPGIVGDEIGNDPIPFIILGSNPIRLPIMPVEMNDRNLQLIAETTGKRRFSSSARSQDKDPLHTPSTRRARL